MLKWVGEFAKTRTAITVAVLVFIAASSLLRATTFPESDIFWGARNGLDILTRTGLNLTQPDSWNAITLGEEWSPNSWLWNVLLGAFYKVFGNYGFPLLTMGTIAAAFGFLWAYLQKLRMAPLTASIILIGCWLAELAFINGRANTADFLILTAFLYTSHQLRTKPVLLIISSFLLTVLWMNLHLTGAVAVGVFPVVIYALLSEERTARRITITALAFLATAAALIATPYGFGGFQKIMAVDSASKGMIIEWSSVWAYPQSDTGTIFLLLAAVPVLIFLAKKKAFLYGLAVMVLAVVTATTIRFAPYLLTVMLGALACFDYNPEFPALLRRFKNSRLYLTGFLFILMVGVSATAVLSVARVAADPESMFPLRPSDFNAIPHGAVVASSQDAGSEMLLYRPDVLVTLDGRNDLMGKTRFVESSNILFAADTGALSAWLSAHRVTTVFTGTHELGAAVVEKNMLKLGWDEERSGDAPIFQPWPSARPGKPAGK